MELVACVFDTADEAGLAAQSIRLGAVGAGSSLREWAVVRWDRDRALPRTEMPVTTHPQAAPSAWFWSLVLSVTFTLPLLGAALGSATGLETGSLTTLGIHDSFMNRLRDEVTPGRSALLLLTGTTGASFVHALAHERGVTIIGDIRFTPRQEASLLEVLS